MPVIVNFRSGPVSGGSIDVGGQVFLASHGIGGDMTQAYACYSIADFEHFYGNRTVTADVPTWDWIDAAFKEGVRVIWVGSYATVGAYANAFSLFDKEKGPGQLVVVGETEVEQLYADMATEATAKGRFAVLDVPSGASLSAMEALGDALPTDATGENLALYGPWLTFPAPSGVVGASGRLIPTSALVCGVMARVEADGNPNRAPGGRDYPAQYASSVSLATSDTDRDTAVGHKLNLVRMVDGLIQVDSARTAIPKDPSTPFWQVNCSRARMWAKAKSRSIGNAYYMKNIDAEGHLAGALKKDLVGMLLDLYSRDGLYGVTPQEAFDVNVSVQVNNPLSAANATLTAVGQMRFSLAAETIEVDLVSIPILGTIVPS